MTLYINDKTMEKTFDDESAMYNEYQNLEAMLKRENEASNCSESEVVKNAHLSGDLKKSKSSLF